MAKIRDQEIVGRVLEGQEDYFRHLVQRYQQPVAKFIYFNLPSANEVEDLTQETFLRAYRYLKSYDPRQSFKNWLLAIAANLCRHWRRRRIVTVPLKTIFHLPSSENVALEVLENEAVREVKNLLGGLPPKEAAVLTLHYINTLTIREIAAALKIPEGTVKSRLNRGLNRLRQGNVKKSTGRDPHEAKIERTI